ncbi:MAG TPA: hypothetical protein VJR58_25830 [Vineibacter sp.]|nr:hypothetical protein [Vineibacter sp.]
MSLVDVACVGNASGRKQGWRANFASFLMGAIRIGETYVDNMLDVVRAVEALPAGTLVGGLFLIDHGSDMTCMVGADDIGGNTLNAVPLYGPLLRRLRARMGGESIIHMMQCEAGKHESMLKALAAFTGAHIYGGTGNHSTVYNYNHGVYVCATPSGGIRRDVRRPRAWGFGG